jgi:thioredoxin reductase/SAM-dependent methyltransferase
MSFGGMVRAPLANTARDYAETASARILSFMAEHQVRPITRECDVVVIGGSAAGLAAALQIARQRRSVIDVDSGDPRNAPAADMHGFLTHDGIAPSELVEAARAEVRGYGVEVVAGLATGVDGSADEGFRVALSGGHHLGARAVVVATGIVDLLPEIDGLADHWGRGVIHCPFCHGYEVRDRRIVHVITHPMGFHPASLWRNLSAHYSVVVDDSVSGAAGVGEHVAALRSAGVPVRESSVARIVSDAEGRLSGLVLASGEALEADVVAVGPRFRPRTEVVAPLGVRVVEHPSGMGSNVEVDASGATSVPGVFAAGNVTDPSQQVLAAAAHGAWVGAMASFALAAEDLRTAARPSGNERDWDGRYRAGQLWSGNPNGTLVHEMTGAPSGRALDVGAGEGGDAIWLAEQGWAVTASDISGVGLQRLGDEAARRGLSIECLQADATALDPFARGRYDLVSAQYASIPRSPDGRGLHNVLDAVAIGGTLLVVSHDLAPMRKPIDTAVMSMPFDPDAYVRVEDFAGALDGRDDWEVVVNEKRPRPHGAVSSHHVDDLVLRARRLR